MWTKNANLLPYRNPEFDNDGLSGDGAVTWQHALDYAAKLNAENYLGQTDWRLPNRKELFSLIDHSRCYLPSPISQPFTNVQAWGYWSSTTYANHPDYACVINMWSGGVDYGNKSDYINYCAWPVRGGQTPTVITLSSFTATPSDKAVLLKWTTESEIDNAGFNLYRAESENGEYVKINDSLIPAEGSPTQGASYQFIDEGVKNRTTYYYKLEDVDIYGKSTFHDPVSAVPRGINRRGR
jgi:hypothetical protein